MLCAGQSFVHLEDLIEAIVRLIHRRSTLPAVLPLLIGEPEALGYADIQNIIGLTMHGDNWKTVQVPNSLAWAGSWLQTEVLGDPEFIKPWMVEQANDHYVLDISRAKQLLDWQPKHRLRDTLPNMIAALKRDPTGWYRTNKLNPAAVAWYGRGSSAHQAHAKQLGGGHEAANHAADHGHMQAMAEDERRTRWAHFANIGLGCWLAASPLAFEVSSGLTSVTLDFVTSDRGLPSIALRSHLLAISDVVSGLLIVLFGVLSLSRRSAWFAQWANTIGWTLAVLRTAVALEPDRGPISERSPGRRTRDHLRRASPDDAGYEHGGNDGSKGGSPRLDILPVELGAKTAHSGAWADRSSHCADAHRLSAWAC